MQPLVVEITNIFPHGIWLLAYDEELFLPYEDFPWFRDYSLKVILNAEQPPSQDHYYRPEIDADLNRETLKTPSRFPLMAKIT